MFKLGIDLGYGYVKGVAQNGKILVFPSVVGKGKKRHLGGLFGGTGKDYEVLYNGQHYFVGDLALSQMVYDATRAFEEERYDHYSTPVLLATAAALLAPPGQPLWLATGLPLAYSSSKKEAFREALLRVDARVEVPGVFPGERRIKFDQVTLFPQAAAALYAELLDISGNVRNAALMREGGLVGVVDVGYRTTDYLLIDLDGLDVLESHSGTLNKGMSDAYVELQARLEEEIDSSIDLLEVEAAAMRGRLYYAGKCYDLTAKMAEVSKSLAQAIADRLNLSWRDKRKLVRRLYVAGGGAKMLGPYLETSQGSVEIVPNPQLANARGYLAVIMRQDRTAATA